MPRVEYRVRRKERQRPSSPCATTSISDLINQSGSGSLARTILLGTLYSHSEDWQLVSVRRAAPSRGGTRESLSYVLMAAPNARPGARHARTMQGLGSA